MHEGRRSAPCRHSSSSDPCKYRITNCNHVQEILLEFRRETRDHDDDDDVEWGFLGLGTAEMTQPSKHHDVSRLLRWKRNPNGSKMIQRTACEPDNEMLLGSMVSGLRACVVA
jgi:hypothetical protein